MKVRCLTDDQIEQFAGAGCSLPAKIARHLDTCEKCRKRLQEATSDEEVVRQLRELRESRARIAHLIPDDPTTIVPAR